MNYAQVYRLRKMLMMNSLLSQYWDKHNLSKEKSVKIVRNKPRTGYVVALPWTLSIIICYEYRGEVCLFLNFFLDIVIVEREIIFIKLS